MVNVILKAIAVIFAVEVDPSMGMKLTDSLVAISSLSASFIFDITAIYGRIVAKKQIVKSGDDP